MTKSYKHALIRRLQFCSLIGLCWATTPAFAATSTSDSPPVCPGTEAATFPGYSAENDPPAVAAWKGLSALPADCHLVLDGPAAMTVGFAGVFTGPASIEDIASSIGEISGTEGLKYWSVTDERWKEFISEAYAIESPDNKKKRQDFTAREIASKRPLYFAQNDTRSWGTNAYRMKAVDASPDRLIIETRNETAVKAGPVTILKARAAQSVIFINRRDASTWEYYSLSVIKGSRLPVNEKSLINRQASLYRLLTGKQVDMEPPLAR